MREGRKKTREFVKQRWERKTNSRAVFGVARMFNKCRIGKQFGRVRKLLVDVTAVTRAGRKGTTKRETGKGLEEHRGGRRTTG